jgi:uncharacterized protein YebE (UPF0316 family)
MTGLYDGIGQMLALFLFILIVIPVVTVLVIKQLKPVRLLPAFKRYLLYLIIYIAAAVITLLIIRMCNRMWQFQLFAGIGILVGTFALLNHMPGNNK